MIMVRVCWYLALAASASVSYEALAEDTTRFLIPAKSQVVFAMDIAVMRDSGIFDEDLREGFTDAIENNEQVAKLCKLLQLDLLKDIKRFTFCGVGRPGARNADDENLAIINGRFDFERYTKTLGEQVDAGELTRLSVKDLPVYYNHRERQAVYFSVLDNDTAIASSNKQAIETAIEGFADLREPSQEMKDRFEWKADESNWVFRVGGIFPEEARRGIARNPQMAAIANKLVGYNVVATLGETGKASGRLVMADANSANQAVLIFKTLLAFGKVAINNQPKPREDIAELVDKIAISAEEETVIFSIEADKELVTEIVKRNRIDGREFRERARKERDRIRKQRAEQAQEPSGKETPKEEKRN